jgi:hypothetical protein
MKLESKRSALDAPKEPHAIKYGSQIISKLVPNLTIKLNTTVLMLHWCAVLGQPRAILNWMEKEWMGQTRRALGKIGWIGTK